MYLFFNMGLINFSANFLCLSIKLSFLNSIFYFLQRLPQICMQNANHNKVFYACLYLKGKKSCKVQAQAMYRLINNCTFSGPTVGAQRSDARLIVKQSRVGQKRQDGEPAAAAEGVQNGVQNFIRKKKCDAADDPLTKDIHESRVFSSTATQFGPPQIDRVGISDRCIDSDASFHYRRWHKCEGGVLAILNLISQFLIF